MAPAICDLQFAQAATTSRPRPKTLHNRAGAWLVRPRWYQQRLRGFLAYLEAHMVKVNPTFLEPLKLARGLLMHGHSRPQRCIPRASLPYPAKQAVHNCDDLEPKLSHSKNAAKILTLFFYVGGCENVYIFGHMEFFTPIFHSAVRVRNLPLPYCSFQ